MRERLFLEMIMNTLKKLMMTAGVIVLTACASATPYQPSTHADARNGFSETQIENDRVRITFDGNSLTKRETVETYLIFRAAELTKQNGYDYFTLTDRAVDKETRLQSSGFNDPYYGFFDYSYFHPRYGWSNPYYRPYYSRYSRAGFGYRDPFYDPFYGRSNFGRDFDYREISRYRASAEVKFGRGTKPANTPNAFNAQEVIENLGANIVYPEVK